LDGKNEKKNISYKLIKTFSILFLLFSISLFVTIMKYQGVLVYYRTRYVVHASSQAKLVFYVKKIIGWVDYQIIQC
jgi:hypothetical protein